MKSMQRKHGTMPSHSNKHPVLHCPPVLKVFCAVSSQVIAALANVILRFKNTGDKILNTSHSVRFGSLSITSENRAETHTFPLTHSSAQRSSANVTSRKV
jgi:hypothetical protein